MSGTLQAKKTGGYSLNYQNPIAIYDMRGNGDGAIAPTMSGDHNSRPSDWGAVVIEPRYYTRGNKTGGAPSELASITNAHKSGDSAPVVVQHNDIVGPIRSNSYNNSDPMMEAQQLVVQQNVIGDPDVANAVETKDHQNYANQVGTAVVAFNIQHNDGGVHKRKDRPNGGLYVQETDTALTVGTTDLTAIANNATVRRMTPTEAERLQAFPDGHTAGQADTPRYKQLGNAVCVNVVEWIVRRIPALPAAAVPGTE